MLKFGLALRNVNYPATASYFVR